MNKTKEKLGLVFFSGIILMVFLSILIVGEPDERSVQSTLTSIYVDEAPTVDGSSGDTAWADAEAITTSIGVTLKSVYTDSTIYFLAIWSDSTQSDAKNQWSFSGGTWSKSNNEDRLALAWNIGETTANFNEDGCSILCHVPSMQTNAESEKIDAWHWKAARTDPVGYADDKWWDNADTTDDHEASRHGDSRDSGSYKDNKQTLNNSVDEITVPKYYEPDATGDDAKFITKSEIDDGEAVMITSVDLNGTLTYSGGSVPSSAKLPGYYLEKPVGSRGDIASASTYADGKWTVELSRALNTGNDDDVVFTAAAASMYFFGVATFDNSGGVSHVTTNADVYKLVFVKDSDGDGVSDNLDAFPNDPAEIADTDMDGVGDNGDAFPADGNETADSDSDGVGDNADVFPNDAAETKDTDSDSVGDNADAFPSDAAASVDGDSDGYPDEWNSGKTEADSTTGLELDAFPDDSEKWAEDKESEDDDSDSNLMIIAIIVVVVVVVLVLIMAMSKKKKD